MFLMIDCNCFTDGKKKKQAQKDTLTEPHNPGEFEANSRLIVQFISLSVS